MLKVLIDFGKLLQTHTIAINTKLSVMFTGVRIFALDIKRYKAQKLLPRWQFLSFFTLDEPIITNYSNKSNSMTRAVRIEANLLGQPLEMKSKINECK